MKIGIEIDHKEFLRLREKLQSGHVALEEREILQTKFGQQVLENIITEKLIPNWHCTNCKSDWSTVGDMTSCPKCFTASLEYVGPPRVGKEIPGKVVRLREASRSDMEQGTYYRASKDGSTVEEHGKKQYEYQKERNAKQRAYFKKCPENHVVHYKGVKDGYNVYFCETEKQWKLWKD